jgi:hypothetical protein
MPDKNSSSKKNRRTTRSTKVIKDLPPRPMGDGEKREVKGGGRIVHEDFPITKLIDKSSP